MSFLQNIYYDVLMTRSQALMKEKLKVKMEMKMKMKILLI